MVSDEAGGSSPASPAGKLRAAFEQHADATGWPWTVSVRPLTAPRTGPRAGSPGAARIDLSCDDASALADLLQHAAEPAARRGTRGLSGEWIGTAHAAKMLDVAQSTIRGWVTRNGPKDNPFPPPDRNDPGRNFWQKRTISRWQARQRRIDQQRRRRGL